MINKYSYNFNQTATPSVLTAEPQNNFPTTTQPLNIPESYATLTPSKIAYLMLRDRLLQTQKDAVPTPPQPINIPQPLSPALASSNNNYWMLMNSLLQTVRQQPLPTPTSPVRQSKDTLATPTQPTSVPISSTKEEKLVDQIFKPKFCYEGETYLYGLEFEEKFNKQGIEFLPQSVPQYARKAVTQIQQARSDKTKKELADKCGVKDPDGRNWDFNTVLFRGISLPDPILNKIDVASTESMTEIIGHTFAEGMHPNGYVHQADGSPSKYYDELTFEGKAHNWLVSTSFDFGISCAYATGLSGVSRSGVVFLIDASKPAMKDLYGVNLTARGLVGKSQKEMAFLFIPPEYILGALPVMFYSQTGHYGDYHKVYPKGFVPNPHAKTKIDSSQLTTLCGDPDWQDVIKNGERMSRTHEFNETYEKAKAKCVNFASSKSDN